LGAGQGIVAGFIDLAPLAADLAASYGGGQPDEFLVTSRDSRTVITRSIAPKRWIGASLAGTPFGPSALGVPHTDLNGKHRLYAESTLPGLAWHMFVGEDEAVALAAAGRLVRHQLEIIALGLAAALLASFLIYRRVARPITRLAAAVRQASIASGPATVPASGPAEVTALAHDVNGLISSVRKELQERERAEAHAKDLAAIVEFSNDAIVGKTLDGTITSWNAAAERIYGYSAREAVGSPISMLAPEELQGELPELLAQVSEGARIEQYETIRRRKDGTAFDVSLTISPIKDRRGTVVGASTIARDVTDHRRLEEQLLQAQKMEAVGNLAGGIAHDFNNLLLVVRGYSARLLESLDDASLRESAQQIDNAAQRAGEFTHQLLAFSRQQVLRPEVTDLNEVVRDTLKLLQHAIGEDIRIESELGPDVQPIHVDRGQLTQAVLNLAINARDSMSDAGGTLSVRTAHAELDQAYADRHEDVSAGSYSVLQITDSGKGMDQATQSRVFDPFFTTKEDGTGLGLASVYGLVKQSGGHIWLYSEPLLGTTFKLYFPTSAGTIARPGTTAEIGSLTGTETILLVEDAEMVRQFVATTLEGYGYHVLAAAGGTEAIELAARAAQPIDLLMTDVVMPWMNGRELVERLTPGNPGMKVLYTSGYPSDTIVREGIAEAGAAFLEKPYLPVDLAAKVREVFGQGPASDT
jgi:PAS domain S-box-containing protein